jgi:hypothetical protein
MRSEMEVRREEVALFVPEGVEEAEGISRPAQP